MLRLKRMMLENPRGHGGDGGVVVVLEQMQVPQRRRFGFAVFGILHFIQIDAASEALVLVQQFRLWREKKQLAQRGEKSQGGRMILMKRQSRQSLRERQQSMLRDLRVSENGSG